MEQAKHSLHDRKTDVPPKAKPLPESPEDPQLSSPGPSIYFFQPGKPRVGQHFQKELNKSARLKLRQSLSMENFFSRGETLTKL